MVSGVCVCVARAGAEGCVQSSPADMMWNSCSSGGLGHPQARMGGPRGVPCGTYWMTVSSVPARILWFEPAWAWCSRRGRDGILMLGICCALAAHAGLLPSLGPIGGCFVVGFFFLLIRTVGGLDLGVVLALCPLSIPLDMPLGRPS